MADGRELIEEVVAVLGELPERVGAVEGPYTADQRAELDEILESANKWAGMCRKKQWLRGAEGTGMAQGCLDAARRLRGSLDQPTVAIEHAADVAAQLERLARLLATKSTVMT
ncbi:MAG: hypothetical protein BWY10_02597 [Chloroflexi bacterium ADurb.Bin180]|nr:MAG: hypothetical protein BWY10_02597 [Chloroflexi bacterium ADurb.Bin180]